MTLTSLPKPPMGELGQDDAPENEDGDESDDFSSRARGGDGTVSGKAAGLTGGLPGKRVTNRVPAECPFDRDEILQIWSRFAPVGSSLSCTYFAHHSTVKLPLATRATLGVVA